MLALWMLACGESVTFEEPAAAEPVEDVAPSVAPEVAEPIDARPEIDGEPTANAAPAPGAAWPPIVVPQDAREREWKWDFKSSPDSKKDEEEPPTEEELRDIELRTAKTGEIL